MELVREFCAENFEKVPAAIAAGAGRVELCDNLAKGGTTPSAGVIGKTCAYAHAHNVPVMCMIRPRGGSFCYTDEELSMMELDIRTAVRLGADGVVFGCTSRGPSIDWEATRRLARETMACAAERGRALDITFHMAFDELDERAQEESLPMLAQMGVTRVLTHGGPAGSPIDANLGRLARLVACAERRSAPRILPGAGITHRNAVDVARALGVCEVHGTRIVDLP